MAIAVFPPPSPGFAQNQPIETATGQRDALLIGINSYASPDILDDELELRLARLRAASCIAGPA